MVSVTAVYQHPEQAADHQAWVDHLAAALQDGDPRAYVNFLGDEKRGSTRPTRARPGTGWPRSRPATTPPTYSTATRTSPPPRQTPMTTTTRPQPRSRTALHRPATAPPRSSHGNGSWHQRRRRREQTDRAARHDEHRHDGTRAEVRAARVRPTGQAVCRTIRTVPSAASPPPGRSPARLPTWSTVAACRFASRSGCARNGCSPGLSPGLLGRLVRSPSKWYRPRRSHPGPPHRKTTNYGCRTRPA
jgi:hypothetical protein